jgi:hypothetical protein
MSEVNETFVPNSLSEEFVTAIENCIINPCTLNIYRNCRSLIMHKGVIDNFLLCNIDGCAPIIAKGGGWIEWFVCRYKSKLYFVFLGTNSGEKTVSARSTNLNEIISHLKNVDNGGGVNIDGDTIPYDQVYFSDEDLDGGALDFKTSMARHIHSRI